MNDNKKGLVTHTFNDWQSIKEDPTLNIDFFMDGEDTDKESNTPARDSKPKQVVEHTFLDTDKIREDESINIDFFMDGEKNNTPVKDSKPRISNSPTILYRATRYCPEECSNEPTKNGRSR